MDLEEVEENYQQQLEKAEKGFLKALADKKKNSSEAEKAYKEEVKKAREQYKISITKYLEKEKKTYGKKKKKEKKEELKHFKVEPGNFELSWWLKQRLKWRLFFFKTHFSTRNTVRENTPSFFYYQYFKWRLLIKRTFRAIGEFMSGIWSSFVSIAKHDYELAGDVLKKVVKYLSSLPGKVSDLISRIRGKEKKKGKGKDGEKKEGEEKSEDKSKEEEAS